MSKMAVPNEVRPEPSEFESLRLQSLLPELEPDYSALRAELIEILSPRQTAMLLVAEQLLVFETAFSVREEFAGSRLIVGWNCGNGTIDIYPPD